MVLILDYCSDGAAANKQSEMHKCPAAAFLELLYFCWWNRKNKQTKKTDNIVSKYCV